MCNASGRTFRPALLKVELGGAMEFTLQVEETLWEGGRCLFRLVSEGGPDPEELARLGVTKDSIVRVNRQGDIELRRQFFCDVFGSLS